MNLFDKDRRRVQEEPLFLDGSVIPLLYVRVVDLENVEVEGYFQIGFNRFAPRSCQLKVWDLSTFFRAWVMEPEEVARKFFNWAGREPASEPASGQQIVGSELEL